jgi:bifunctional UDP-N-acetylglucosamine pyrophosphorylase/glucosamine-1-phosphate N-acetyltransferase
LTVYGLVLAAGQGKRMLSSRPKVLHEVGGRPMVAWVRDALIEAGVDRVVAVVSPNAPAVEAALGKSVQLAYQPEPLGTGHAVMQAMPLLGAAGAVLVVFGDTPLLRPATLRALIRAHQAAQADAEPPACTMLTARIDDPTGYGRIIRDDGGAIAGIVEQADCSPPQAAMSEINPGILVFNRHALESCLPRLSPRNRQGEYYITDVIGIIVDGGGRVASLEADPLEVLGVNSRMQLAEAGEALRWRELERVMAAGVTVIDPATTHIHPGVEVGRDTVIWPGSYLLGATRVGANCTIGPGSYIVDAVLGEGASVWFSVIEESTIEQGCSVGPYSHLRPDTHLAAGAKVGNFAEIKNSYVGPGTKIPHHSYVGDADVGPGVNIGAGAVFVNYDGFRKHRATVDAGAFVGCNANLVAPVTVGERAYVACGSSVTEDVPPGALAIARERQRNIEGWVTRRQSGPRAAPPAGGKGAKQPEEPGPGLDK